MVNALVTRGLEKVQLISQRVSSGLHLVVVSTFPPRRCGIAAFTGDLCEALAAAAPGWCVEVVAVDRDAMNYDERVRTLIRQDNPDDYLRAADAIAQSGCDLVLIQHEFGIFGGSDGGHVLALARRLRERRVPYVVTLHTVLAHASPGQTAVLRELCGHAALVTVFTETARQLLADLNLGSAADLGTAGNLGPAGAGQVVVVVPHGAPQVLRAPVGPERLRPELTEVLTNHSGRTVLTTFGLIGPGKGLEVALAALPEVVAAHPDVRYVIAGATHPEEIRAHGERYREHLRGLAERLGVLDHIDFVDAFLTDAEVSALLAHTDVFITPYLSPEQICSGALTFGVAAGCPVVASDYRYARDLLLAPAGQDAPGVIVPCNDSAALAGALTGLLADPEALGRARRAAEALGATLMWPAVATQLVHVLASAVQSADGVGEPAVVVDELAAGRLAAGGLAVGELPVAVGELAVSELTVAVGELPVDELAVVPGALVADAVPAAPLRLTHLERLTRRGAIIQFARGSEPDEASGTCVDDVARLGIVANGLCHRSGVPQDLVAEWLAGSVRFLAEAVGPGGLRNMCDLDGGWRDEPHLGDHVGRALWALGVVAAGDGPATVRTDAAEVLLGLLPLVTRLGSVRSVAYSVLGLARVPELAEGAVAGAAGRLLSAQADRDGWCWFEPRLAYDNARLPQALLAAGSVLGEGEMVRRGLVTLDWYLSQVGLTDPRPMLRCVPNGWLEVGAAPVGGDEQPLDAAATVEALVRAWQLTLNERYARLARTAHAWFHGVNRAGAQLHDPATGGCYDGLREDGPNLNMGAESTLAYYQSMLCLVEAGLLAPPRPGQPPSPVPKMIFAR